MPFIQESAARIPLVFSERNVLPDLVEKERIDLLVVENKGDKRDPDDYRREAEYFQKDFRADIVRLVKDDEQNDGPQQEETYERERQEIPSERDEHGEPVGFNERKTVRYLTVEKPHIKKKYQRRDDFPENLNAGAEPEEHGRDAPGENKNRNGFHYQGFFHFHSRILLFTVYYRTESFPCRLKNCLKTGISRMEGL
jgi:hypothetical protein